MQGELKSQTKKDDHWYSQLGAQAEEEISDTGKWKGMLRRREAALRKGEQEAQLEQVEQPCLSWSLIAEINQKKCIL